MKKLLIIGLLLVIPAILCATGLHIGMPGAVKAKVKELNDKVFDKKYTAGNLVITSVKQGSSGASAFITAKTSPKLAASCGYICSGAPDYIKATLERITVQTESGKHVDAWTGSQELYMDGSGTVDTSGISLTLPKETINRVILSFARTAKVKGTVTATINTSVGSITPAVKTFYTRSAYSYDALNHTGGAADFTKFETGPAEETNIDLGAGDYAFAEIPVLNGSSASLDPTLTILVDLNRMLRFNDGVISQGPLPGDLGNKAYFFGHTLFQYSVAAFIGAAGTIQGYQTEYSAYPAGQPIGSGADTTLGWMTLIFDSTGNFLSGNLIPDNDNALVGSKGAITRYTGSDITYELGSTDADIRRFTATGFAKQTSLNAIAPVTTWSESTSLPGVDKYHGEATFTLLFQR
jgi:hypothetical protein